MIDGGTDDDIRRHIDENGLSTQHSVEYRREEAIKSIGVVKSKAEKARHVAARGIDVRLKEDEFRSLDDTLSHILERGTLSTVDQGSMRLLFGFAVLPDDQVSLPVVTQLKSNAAGILRHKLAVADKAKLFTGSPRALEGEGLLYRTVNRTRTGYPTVQSIAETIAFDKESHTKAAYTHDVERNQAMIETYISEALDILYPENVDISE
ncbi:hypothetical protein H7142_02895, partial [Candidatus Saccharibacteria bacterium]|nr:hypothetical protein [Candidatus Saccharibacteria bacterium]